MLADVLRLGRTFKYGYVFGEDWQHTVEIEAVAPAEPGVVYPRLSEAQLLNAGRLVEAAVKKNE